MTNLEKGYTSADIHSMEHFGTIVLYNELESYVSTMFLPTPLIIWY
jgi:hypothetical protein